MSDLLSQAWESGRLIRPDASKLNTIDLIRALANLTGVPDLELELGPGTTTLAGRIGTHEHIVFVLIDGMGMNLLGRLRGNAFLSTHLAMELQAVFPSTTAAAVTTLATGLWPAEHGVMGWWAYLAEHHLSIVTLPFVERMTGKPLEKFGLDGSVLWPFQPLRARMRHEPRAIHPAAYWNSVFACFANGGRDFTGSTSIDSAVDQVIGRLTTATCPTYTYLYLDDLDTTCHADGTDGEETLKTLMRLDAQMARLAAALYGRARLVVSADHGHLNVPAADHLAIRDGDLLLETLVVPPTGEPRVPYFHVREGREDEFLATFAQRYGHQYALLPIALADDLRLFGPVPLSPTARRCCGDYVGIALEPVTLKYYLPNQKEKSVSHHAGMSPEEMLVPLILA